MSITSSSETEDHANSVTSEADEQSNTVEKKTKVGDRFTPSQISRRSDDSFTHSKEYGLTPESDSKHTRCHFFEPPLKDKDRSAFHLTLELAKKPIDNTADRIGSSASDSVTPISLNKSFSGKRIHSKSFGNNTSNYSNSIGLVRACSSSEIRKFQAHLDQSLPTEIKANQSLRPPHGRRSLSSSASYTRQQQQQQVSRPHQQTLASIRSYLNFAKNVTKDFLSPNDLEIPGHVPNLRSPRFSVAKSQGAPFDFFDDLESIKSIYLNNDFPVSSHSSKVHSRAESTHNISRPSMHYQISDIFSADINDRSSLNVQHRSSSFIGSDFRSSFSSASNTKTPFNAAFMATCSRASNMPSNPSHTYLVHRSHHEPEACDQISGYGSIIYENITEEGAGVSSSEEIDDDVENFTPELEKDLDERRFYDDFTTIDWVRDVINISARHRYIETLPGLRGRMVRIADSCQGWILTIIVAFCFATIAYLVNKSEEFVFGLKFGVCTTNIFLTRKNCCLGIKTNIMEIEDVCSSFRSWESLMLDESNWAGYVLTRTFSSVNRQLIGFVIYTLFSIVFALIAGELTLRSKLSTLVSSKINFEDEKYVPFNAFKKDNTQSSSAGYTSIPILNEENTVERRETISKNSSDNTEFSKLLPQNSRNFSKKTSATHSRTIYACSGSGVPEVKTILSGFVIRGFLGTKTIILKSIGLVFSIASGLAVGKEGPFVHLATCVGNVSCRLFKKYAENDLKRRQILSAASSAGVGLAFGSPIGGVLFALEEVSYYFLPHQLFRIFFCALMSALFLVFYNPYGRGNIVLFEVSYSSNWMMWVSVI